jgi:hypothetical protein
MNGFNNPGEFPRREMSDVFKSDMTEQFAARVFSNAVWRTIDIGALQNSGVAELSPGKGSEDSGSNGQATRSIEQPSGEKSEFSGQFNKSPIKRCFFEAVSCLFGALLLGLWSWVNVYNDRGLRGALLIGAGGLLVAFGFWLFWLGRNPATGGRLL